MGKTTAVTSYDSGAMAGTTQRCPACQRMNRVPPGGVTKARCGACRAPLTPLARDTSVPRSGDLGPLVVQRWDALVRLAPGGMGLARAVGQGGSHGPAADPVSWLSTAAHIPRDELDQVRLLRIHLASNKAVSHDVLTRALATLDRATAALERTRLPE